MYISDWHGGPFSVAPITYNLTVCRLVHKTFNKMKKLNYISILFCQNHQKVIYFLVRGPLCTAHPAHASLRA